MTVTTDGRSVVFEVEERPRLNAAVAAQMVGRSGARAHALIVTEHVRPSVARILQDGGLSYADAAGNCHIDAPPVLIHVEGRTPEKAAFEAPVRVFAGEGLKVVFLLLLQPGLVSRPYRDLAALAGVSHGVVQYAVADLEALGYVVRLSRTARRLLNIAGLLDRWATAYAEVLRPKLTLGTFRSLGGDLMRDWQNLDVEPAHERWGSEPAAALITGHLGPGRLTLYSRDGRGVVMQRLRVVPDEAGQVDIVRAFWEPAVEGEVAGFEGTVVPDVLVYADLLATGDPRNAETAGLLRDRILAGHG